MAWIKAQPRDAFDLPPWARAIGISRVARVTGLDRCGVEVACAVRPDGQVLQLSNGKGDTFVQAATCAVSEAVELWACEHPRPEQLTWRREEPTAQFWPVDFVSPGAFVPYDHAALHAWATARRMDATGDVLLPASLVFSPSNGLSVGLRLRPWTASGVAAHPSRARACLHGLLELLEREALCRVLPDGWTYEVVRQRALRVVHPLRDRLDRVGLRVMAIDAAPTGWPVPVVAVMLVDAVDGAVPLAAGYACRFDPAEALEAALMEACQSRLTEIHGAREDVTQTRHEIPDWIDALPRPRRTVEGLARWTGSARALLKTLGMAAAAVDLSHPRVPLHVVRVFVPGARFSELLL